MYSMTRGKKSGLDAKSIIYIYVLRKTGNLPEFRRGRRFDNLTHTQKVRVGKFHFRSVASSHFVVDA